MEIDSSLLSSEVWRLGHSLYDGVSKDRETDESRSLSAFNSILYDLTDKAFNVAKIIERRPYLNNKIIRENNKGMDMFFENVRKDEWIFKILFANYHNLCVDTDIFNYSKKMVDKKYTDKEVKDLILGFYSLYGNSVYEVIKKYFDEGRIQTGSRLCQNRSDATFYNSLLLKSGYIVVKEKENNINMLTSLAHELGHAVDFGMFYNPQQKKGKFYSDIYQETASSFFEYGFVKYLLDNRIECDESLLYISIFLKEAYYRICRLVDSYMEGNFYSQDFDDKNRNSSLFIYSLGELLSIGMNQVMGEHRQEYMKMFNNFVCSRNEANFVPLLLMAGIDDYQFINGLMFEKEFKDVGIQLKKKFNIKE